MKTNHDTLETSSAASIHRRKPWLARGVRGFTDAAGKFQCTGSQMGRRDCIPSDFRTVKEIIVERVPPYDGGDYDKGGAYWGDIRSKPLYCAWGDSDTEQAEAFFRASGLRDAKAQALAAFPCASIVKRDPSKEFKS